MKLALCLFHYRTHSGLSRDFLDVSREAVERGHTVDVFTQSWQGEQPADLTVHLIAVAGLSNHRRSGNFAKACESALAQNKFDAVIGFNRMQGLDYYFAADLSFIEHAEREHGFLFKFTGRYKTYSRLERAVFSQHSNTHIFSLSEKQTKNFQRQHSTDAKRFTVLPPAVDSVSLARLQASFDPNRFRSAQSIHADQLILLMVGSDFNTKGVDRSIQALAQLPSSLIEQTLLIVVGAGKRNSMDALARRLGVEHSVRLLGARDDVFEWMLVADLLLQPSRVESAGNSIAEALAAGLPTIVSDNCGFAEHVKNSEAGALVSGRPFDIDQFSNSITLGLDHQTNERWRQNARDYCASTQLSGRASALLNRVETFAGA